MAGAEFKITDAIDPEITKKLHVINEELIAANKNLADFVVKAAQKITLKVDNIGDLERKQQLFSAAIAEANKEQERMMSLQNQARGIYQQVADKLSTLVKSVDGLSAKMDSYTKHVQDSSAALQQNVTTSQQAEAAMQKAGQSARLASKDYEAIVSTIREYDAAVTKSNLSVVQQKVRLEGVRNTMSALKKEYMSGGMSLEKYESIMGKLQKKELELKSSIQQEMALLRNHASVVVSAAGSYYEMNAAVLELEKRFKSLDAGQREGAIGQQTLADIQKLKNELKSIDAQMGNYQRNVGNYASGWNGLQMSVQQVARELPSLAIGWNTFFLAISNNLPMLADEIKKARVEYNALRAAGEKATPVWKQVIGSLLNWQTALVAGIALLSVYGDEILEWIGNLFKGKNALDTVGEAMTDISAKIQEENTGVGDLIVKLKTMQQEWRNLGDNLALQQKYIADNKSRFDELGVAVSSVSDVERLFSEEGTKSFVEAMKQRALSIAAMKTASSVYEKIVNKQIELDEAQNKVSSGDKFKASIFGGTAEDFRKTRVYGLEGDIKRLKEEADAYFNLSFSKEQESQATLKAAGIKEKSTEEDKKRMEDYASYIKRINEELSSLSIEGIKNRYERERAEMKTEHDKKMAEITGNTEKEIALRKELNAKLERDTASSRAKESLEVERVNLENRLAAAEEGSQEELAARLDLLKNQKKMEIAEAAETGASVLAIEKKYTKERDKLLEEEAANNADKIANRYALGNLLGAEDVSTQIKELTQAYADGKMKKEEYEAEVLKIQQDYALKSAQAAVESIEEQLKVQNLSEEDRVRLEEELHRAKIALSDEETRVILENDEKQKRSVQEKQKAIEDYLSRASEILNGLSALGNALFEREIQQIEEEQEANEDAGEKELERIEQLEESGVLTKEEAEARKRAAEAKTEAKSEELEKKKAALQRKQAIWDKANQLAQASIATALAITRALPNIPLSVLVGAMGAVQIATILATPIPKYAKGTNYHKGGLALVGDGGEHELVQTAHGVWLTPDIPTLVDLPRGASVIPNVDVDRIINDNLFLDVEKYQREAQEQGIVVLSEKSDYDYGRLEAKIDRLAKVMEKGFKSNEKQLKDAAYREYIRSKM